MILSFFDPLSFAIVVFGSVALATAQHGRAGALSAWECLVSARQAEGAEAMAAQRLMRAATATVHHRGLFAAEQLEPDHAFLRAALQELAGSDGPDSFARWASHYLSASARPAQRAAHWWGALADAAPSLGMAGTVGGLIMLFGSGGAGAAVGSGLAVAMVTTLYGLLLSGVIAGPMAVRLQMRALAERQWQQAFVDDMAALLEREVRSVPHNARRAA